jgi:hypothetical protein
MIFFAVLGIMLSLFLKLLLFEFLLCRFIVTQADFNFVYLGQTGKFGALFASIPLPIFAGMYCVFFAYVGMFRYLNPTAYIR